MIILFNIIRCRPLQRPRVFHLFWDHDLFWTTRERNFWFFFLSRGDPFLEENRRKTGWRVAKGMAGHGSGWGWHPPWVMHRGARGGWLAREARREEEKALSFFLSFFSLSGRGVLETVWKRGREGLAGFVQVRLQHALFSFGPYCYAQLPFWCPMMNIIRCACLETLRLLFVGILCLLLTSFLWLCFDFPPRCPNHAFIPVKNAFSFTHLC